MAKPIPLIATAAVALAAGALIGGLLVPALASTPSNSPAEGQQQLEPGNWAPDAYAALTRMIDQHRGADPSAPDAAYAVFDWDNTSVISDVTDKLFLSQMMTLSYALSPDQFAEVLVADVPAGELGDGFRNLAGEPITRDAIVSDIVADYRVLFDAYEGLGGEQPLSTVQASPEHQDFRAKLFFYYTALIDTHGPEIAYPWETFFFAGMTPEAFTELATEAIREQLGSEITTVRLASPAETPGAAGRVETEYLDGIRTVPEIINLMHTLQSNGIDVYVVTAGFEWMIEAIATNPAFGYALDADHVFGLRLETAEDGTALPLARAGWPFTYDAGKPELVRQEIAPQHGGRDPVFVAGDSGSDYGNFTEFGDTEVLVLVNYLPTGRVGELAQRAADTRGTAEARIFLQGVDERIGLWRPSAESILFGEREPRLLAAEPPRADEEAS